jgi:hypothetical protein
MRSLVLCQQARAGVNFTGYKTLVTSLQDIFPKLEKRQTCGIQEPILSVAVACRRDLDIMLASWRYCPEINPGT